MRSYELMTIANISLGDEKAKEVSKEIQEFISSNKGTISKADFWGKRKFAYEIKGAKEGYYDVLHFELDPAVLEKLKTKIKFDPKNEQIVGNDEAARMLGRPLRAPWSYSMPLNA